ncbi:MAG TPA: DUF305 domain-containing protein [Pyrinomonadaceae bacterium]
MQSFALSIGRNLSGDSILRNVLLAVGAILSFFSFAVHAQQAETKPHPVIVQPGAPGQATQILPSTTRAKLPPLSAKDVEFMQGMIMHHAQAIEMTALINERTTNKNLRLLGSRISHSQADEMKYMVRWLELRGESTSMSMPSMQHAPGMDMSKHQHHMLMPGMLTQEQMEALKNAKGAEFDRLFLTGMIQHHKGALVMVEELFNTAGSGQDSELFNFATEVDNGQRAEIRVMETMLGERP